MGAGGAHSHDAASGGGACAATASTTPLPTACQSVDTLSQSPGSELGARLATQAGRLRNSNQRSHPKPSCLQAPSTAGLCPQPRTWGCAAAPEQLAALCRDAASRTSLFMLPCSHGVVLIAGKEAMEVWVGGRGGLAQHTAGEYVELTRTAAVALDRTGCRLQGTDSPAGPVHKLR